MGKSLVSCFFDSQYKSVNVEEPTAIPGLKDMCRIIQLMATQNRMGAEMPPSLTPEVEEILYWTVSVRP